MSADKYNDAGGGRRGTASPLQGIYALVEPGHRPLEAFVEALLAGGVRLFQIRAKNGLAPHTLIAVVAMVRSAGGVTLVNDDVEAASFADGVHLGQEDAALHDLHAVRQRLMGRLIGLSCGTAAEARAADPAIFDYVGVGPIFATASKADAGEPIGVSGVRAVVEATALPAAAIGGIDLERIPQVRETGAAMAAIISAFAGANDITQTARAFVAAWNV